MKLWTLIGKIAMKWWTYWSNIRFKDVERFNREINENDKVNSFEEIKDLVKGCYGNFRWTADDASQLWDAITPPPENYKIFCQHTLYDDCDGFHSLIYHILSNSNIEIDCYLLAVYALGGGHCVLLFKYNNKWYINDYTKITEGYILPSAAIENYNAYYVEHYKSKSNVLFNGLAKYDYTEGKFYTVNIEDIE